MDDLLGCRPSYASAACFSCFVDPRREPAFALALAFVIFSRRGPAFAVARSSLTHSKNRVISTGAAHSFIVSSAAEKPASLPTPLPSQDTRLCFSCLSSPQETCFCRARSSLTHPKNRVISTGAAHSFIVSSGAEKPASLPTPFPSQNTRLCSSCSSSPQGTCFCCCPFFSHPLQKPCHFDRSCSQLHREQRSGETRFSTNALPQPRHPPLL